MRAAATDTVALDGDGADIARARHRAVGFLARVQTELGPAVSARALNVTQLVVSELVSNALKYAPGPVLLDLRVIGGLVEVAVGDCAPALPTAWAADAGRVGQHGLEIVMAVCRSFETRGEPVGKRITARLAPLRRPRRPPLGTPPLVKATEQQAQHFHTRTPWPGRARAPVGGAPIVKGEESASDRGPAPAGHRRTAVPHKPHRGMARPHHRTASPRPSSAPAPDSRRQAAGKHAPHPLSAAPAARRGLTTTPGRDRSMRPDRMTPWPRP